VSLVSVDALLGLLEADGVGSADIDELSILLPGGPDLQNPAPASEGLFHCRRSAIITAASSAGTLRAGTSRTTEPQFPILPTQASDMVEPFPQLSVLN